MEIKPGMIVNVTDWGQEYSTNKKWFENYYNKGDIPLDYCIRYAFSDDNNYNTKQHTDENDYLVLFVDEVKRVALITEDGTGEWGKIYLIGVEGIEPPKREMTLEQIEEALGYRITLVK